MRRLWRSLLVFALGPCFVFSSVIAPPEHIHDADSRHPQPFGHRHFEAHHHDDAEDVDHDRDHDRDFDHDHAAHHDHDVAEIEHGEGRVIWLDDAGIQPGTSAFPVLDLVLPSCFEGVTQSTRWVALPCSNAAPPHGPPRRSASLRGPPLPPV